MGHGSGLLDSLYTFFIEPLTMGFMVRALITCIAAAGVCALLSCWLVLVGWSLMGDAVSHSVVPGVVIAYALGLPFALGATVFGMAAVALIGVTREGTQLKEDAVIGIVFTSFFALGLVLVSVNPSHIDLGQIVYGNVLGVGQSELIQILVLAGIVATVLLARRKDLTLFTFDPIQTFTIGLHPRRLQALLLGMLALTCVIALQVVGVILVVALLITPGATARLITNRFQTMLWLAPLMSILCSLAGLYCSYHLDVSPGGMVVLAHGIVFAIAWALSPTRGIPAVIRQHKNAEPQSPALSTHS